MKPVDIQMALSQREGTRLRSVIVRSGGWIGMPGDTVQLLPPHSLGSEAWRIEVYNEHGEMYRRVYVEAENILGLSFVPTSSQGEDPPRESGGMG